MAVAVIAIVLPGDTAGDVGPTVTEVNTGVGPVVSLLLPPHAIIAATTLPAAMVRTTRRNMALAPREGRRVNAASLGGATHSENESGANDLSVGANDGYGDATGRSLPPSTHHQAPCTAARQTPAPDAAPA